nr:hypothetical protein [Anaerolineae bacterium]
MAISLLALSIGLTYFQYRMILTDIGLLYVSDDSSMQRYMADGFTWDDIFENHGTEHSRSDNFIPVFRLVYHGAYAIARQNWAPYAWMLILAHSLMSAIVGYTVYHVTSFFPASLMVVPPLTLSPVLSVGSLYGATFANGYLILLLIFAILLVMERLLSAPSRSLAALLTVLCVLCLGMNTFAVILLPIAGIFAITFKFAQTRTTNLKKLLTPERGDWLLIISIGVAILIYLVFWLIGMVVYSNPLPGETAYCSQADPTPTFNRVFQMLLYSIAGLHFGPLIPLDLFVLVLVPAGGFLLVKLLIATQKSGDRQALRSILWMLAAVVVALGFSAFINIGRRCPTNYVTSRYLLFPAVFVFAAAGFAAAIFYRRLVGREQQLIAVLFLGVTLAYSYTFANEARVYVMDKYLTPRTPVVLNPADEDLLNRVYAGWLHMKGWLVPPQLGELLYSQPFNRYATPIWWDGNGAYLPCDPAVSGDFYNASPWTAASLSTILPLCDNPAYLVVDSSDLRYLDLLSDGLVSVIDDTESYIILAIEP